MTANVWFRILPAQRKMITAAAAGAKFDAALSAQAKLRSKHNTFMAVPVVVLMISNHFPVATYGNTYRWEILIALVLVGWAAVKLIRSFYMRRVAAARIQSSTNKRQAFQSRS